MRAWRAMAGLILLAGFLHGCEGVVSGTEIARVPLQTAEGGPAGGYAPVKFALSPEMNPVAFNFRTDFTMNASEAGKWNTYRATVSKDGAMVAARNFNVNHPWSHPDSSPPAPNAAIHTLFYVDVQGVGDYELTIAPVSPVLVTLKDARVDARRNVQRPSQ